MLGGCFEEEEREGGLKLEYSILPQASLVVHSACSLHELLLLQHPGKERYKYEKKRNINIRENTGVRSLKGITPPNLYCVMISCVVLTLGFASLPPNNFSLSVFSSVA